MGDLLNGPQTDLHGCNGEIPTPIPNNKCKLRNIITTSNINALHRADFDV